MYAAIGYGMVQPFFDHEGEPKYGEYGTEPATWECQQSIECGAAHGPLVNHRRGTV